MHVSHYLVDKKATKNGKQKKNTHTLSDTLCNIAFLLAKANNKKICEHIYI